jgi:hypothetical protein
MDAVSTMPLIAFDTLAYANKLKAVGMDPKIAEVQAELQAGLLNELTTNQLATKKDIQELRQELRQEMHELKFDLLTKLGGVIVACTAILGTLTAVFSHLH